MDGKGHSDISLCGTGVLILSASHVQDSNHRKPFGIKILESTDRSDYGNHHGICLNCLSMNCPGFKLPNVPIFPRVTENPTKFSLRIDPRLKRSYWALRVKQPKL